MTTYTWTVEVETVELDDVREISINIGRRQATDSVRAATATVSGLVMGSATWVAGTILLGDSVVIYADSGTVKHPVFYGIVADIKVTYGRVSNEDTWELQLEDHLAQLGRSLTSASFALSAGDTTWEAVQALASDVGMVASLDGDESPSTVSGTSLGNTNALTVLNQIVATEQGLAYGASGDDTFLFQTRYQFPATPAMVFTDGTFPAQVGEDTSSYNSIVFRSRADSYFDRVVVAPAGLTPQSAGSGERTYTFDSYDETTTQAANLASYVLNQLDVDLDVPAEVSVLAESTTFDVASLTSYLVKPYLQPVSVIMRSTRYECVTQGVSIYATPASSRWTFNLAAAYAFTPFILDSSTYGMLDANRLGF